MTGGGLLGAMGEFFGAMGTLVLELLLLFWAILVVVAMVAIPVLIVWCIWRLVRHEPIIPTRFSRRRA